MAGNSRVIYSADPPPKAILSANTSGQANGASSAAKIVSTDPYDNGTGITRDAQIQLGVDPELDTPNQQRQPTTSQKGWLHPVRSENTGLFCALRSGKKVCRNGRRSHLCRPMAPKIIRRGPGKASSARHTPRVLARHGTPRLRRKTVGRPRWEPLWQFLSLRRSQEDRNKQKMTSSSSTRTNEHRLLESLGMFTRHHYWRPSRGHGRVAYSDTARSRFRASSRSSISGSDRSWG